jgi:hypothetical protein
MSESHPLEIDDALGNVSEFQYDYNDTGKLGEARRMIRLSLAITCSTCSTGIKSDRLPNRPARTSRSSGSSEERKRTPLTVPISPSGDSTRKPSQR